MAPWRATVTTIMMPDHDRFSTTFAFHREFNLSANLAEHRPFFLIVLHTQMLSAALCPRPYHDATRGGSRLSCLPSLRLPLAHLQSSPYTISAWVHLSSRMPLGNVTLRLLLPFFSFFFLTSLSIALRFSSAPTVHPLQ